jgi:hypothetical protein
MQSLLASGGSRSSPVADCCEFGIECSSFMKDEKLLERLGKYQRLVRNTLLLEVMYYCDVEHISGWYNVKQTEFLKCLQCVRVPKYFTCLECDMSH